MERDNGALVFAKPYMKNLNWTKGINQTTGRPLDYDPNKDVQTYAAGNSNEGPKLVCPSQVGGNNYWPSSYSQKTGLLYITALTTCVTGSIDREKHNREQRWNSRVSTTTERWESNLTAVDPVTGGIRSSVHLYYPSYSGTLATGGGLVFLALLDGTVAAFDDTTLAEVWKINVGSGISAPPMTFEVNGKQYVAIISGPSLLATGSRLNTPELREQRSALALYVFGL
jgi:alcohol dehydrogenase (cytochrome c)